MFVWCETWDAWHMLSHLLNDDNICFQNFISLPSVLLFILLFLPSFYQKNSVFPPLFNLLKGFVYLFLCMRRKSWRYTYIISIGCERLKFYLSYKVNDAPLIDQNIIMLSHVRIYYLIVWINLVVLTKKIIIIIIFEFTST